MEQLDATDRRILALLQKEGRISNADLALRVNLSASACHRRVQRLEAAGIEPALLETLADCDRPEDLERWPWLKPA